MAMFTKSVDQMKRFRGWTAEQMRSITVPALVIAGDRDILRPEHAVETFRLLPRSRLAILPGTDHMVIVKRSSWIASMVGEFLDAPDSSFAAGPSPGRDHPR
jgi:pimeloyl-ACP methyl ester carboxylesterase